MSIEEVIAQLTQDLCLQVAKLEVRVAILERRTIGIDYAHDTDKSIVFQWTNQFPPPPPHPALSRLTAPSIRSREAAS